MRKTKTLAAAASLALTVLPLAAQPAAVGLTRIGAAAAVQGLVTAKAPGDAVGRTIQGGKPVFLHDRVKTDAKGRLQVMLLDETVFTLGPNSDMVLDEFVYDPATSAGKITAQVARGTFRFVSGKLARKQPQNVKVKLAVGTMGIRGTTAVGETSPETGSYVANVSLGQGSDTGEAPGVVTLENGGQTQEIPAGYESTASGGAPPSGPEPASDSKVNGINEGMEGAGGKNAGGPGGSLPDEQGSASQTSGASTAEGGGSGAGTGDFQSMTQDLDQNAAQTATQDIEDIAAAEIFVPGGISQWDRVIQDMPSGNGFYSGSGTYACTSGLECPATGTLSFNINIDFTSRMLTGGSVSVGGGGPLGDSTSITGLGIPFGTGPAVVTLNSGVDESVNANFNGTTLFLLNGDTTAAAAAAVILEYDNTLQQASGFAQAPFTPGGF